MEATNKKRDDDKMKKKTVGLINWRIYYDSIDIVKANDICKPIRTLKNEWNTILGER